MRRALSIFAVLATALFPAGAAAAVVVPPENSAVNQYTEGFPTGGGETKTTPKDERKVKPAKTIGAKNANKLADKGSEGQAAAEVAAETAPPPVITEDEATAPSEDEAEPRPRNEGNGAGGAGGGGGANGGGNNAGGSTSGSGNTAPTLGEGPSGDSAIGTLASAATGADSGNLGILLPLILLAILAWGGAYALRQRKRSAAQ